MLLTNKNYGEKAQGKFTVVAHYQNYVIAIDEEKRPYIHFGDFHVFPIGFQTEKDSFIKLDREKLQNDSLYEMLNTYVQKINMGETAI